MKVFIFSLPDIETNTMSFTINSMFLPEGEIKTLKFFAYADRYIA